MKVLLAFNLYAYGKPERGLSYEYWNLYLPMQQVADEVLLFDFATLYQEEGQEGMNRLLLETLRRERPDVALFALYMDEFLPEALAEARRYTRTVAYFFDDIWRREYVARWAPRFDYFTTAIWSCYRRYHAAGLGGAIYSPFGYNEQLYQKKDVPLRHDISFVGGGHPWRFFVVDRLRKAGFKVFAAGPFWPDGKLEQEAMVEVFNASRINLNLSNARQWDARYLLSSWRALRNTLGRRRVVERKVLDGIKGRHFEIAGCGGFQLTYYGEDLERHFRIGDEVAIYLDLDDLIEKARYYLEHEEERERIAAAGHERALREHTATRRLGDLLDAVLAGGKAPEEYSQASPRHG
ncbi:MAG: glycosyltransferase [Gemmatimonadota bacterium]|nr:glycosyltransferase [Gemmatimonadota bacterium]